MKLFVLPTPLPSLVSARCSVSQPLASIADVYCLLRKMVSINMKEMTFLLITIDCSGLWLASQVLTVKEVLYLCYNYASSQTSNPLTKIRAILYPLVLLRSGPYIDRRLPYFPQDGIGILQMQCEMWSALVIASLPLFLSKLHPIWMSHSSNCSSPSLFYN